MNKEKKARVKDIVNKLFDLINYSGQCVELGDEVFKIIEKEHHTLQQSFFRIIQQIIRLYASQPDRFFDGRNEASYEWAKQVKKIKAYLPYI